MTMTMLPEGEVGTGSPLAPDLAAAFERGEPSLAALVDRRPVDRFDRVLTLHRIHQLHTDPVFELGDRVRYQHHPAVAAIKQGLETSWIEELDRELAEVASADTDRSDGADREPDHADEDVATAMRTLAARSRSPAIYRWLAHEAPWETATTFLALEGGPDDLFDDLVAQCQVGLPLGSAKMELASNYWDELGNGTFDAVHNVLYQRFVDAVALPTIADEHRPTEALERSALLGLLATNRALQPEMVGALGMIELQAGPHCRYVDRGLERLGASDDARAFYRMHAVVDPVHGQGWLENAVGPLAAQLPPWGPRMLRGARWKALVNERFFDWAHATLTSAS